MTKGGAWLRFTAAVGFVATLVVLVPRALPQPKPPPGWQTIRPPHDVMALAEVGDLIWSGGRDGVVTIDRQSGKVDGQVQADVKLEYVTSIVPEGDGRGVWVGHGNGLSRFDDSGWRTFTAADGLPDDQVLAVARTREGEIWAGTPAGVARYTNGAWTTFTRKDGLASDAATVIFEDSRGRVWLGNGYDYLGGLTMLDGQGWHTYGTADGLAHNAVNAILEDPEGDLWFGAGFGSRGGASRFDGASWKTLTEADGLAGPKVRSLFQDSGQVMWFGSEYDGLACRDGQTWQGFSPGKGLAGREVKAMLEDSRGDLWLGTENGISRVAQSHRTCR
jgi:ligand-binding sensor domain-containing protein